MSEHHPIHQWPEAERPRERLLEHGAARLSDAELLALLIGSGTRGRSAVEVARPRVVTEPRPCGELHTPRTEVENTWQIGLATRAHGRRGVALNFTHQ